jgi:hypothetical protein
MAFIHGKNTSVLYNGSDLSSYFNDASMSQDVETAETTAFGDDAKTYITGLKDGTMSMSGMFDGQTDAIDAVLTGTLGATAADVATVVPAGLSSTGVATFSAEVRETSYEISSPVGDVVAANLEVQATGGIDRGVLLAGGSTLSASATGTAVNHGSSTSSGGVGYLHVTSNTRDGASTFKVQDSSDGVTYADLVTFASVSASATGGERVAVTGSVDQYVRAEVVPGGSSGSVTYTMAFARK